MAKGIFDTEAEKKTVDSSEPKVVPIEDKKEDFSNVFQQQSQQASKRASDAADAGRRKSTVMDDSIAQINASGLGGKSAADRVDEEIAEMDSVSEEDLALAEELVFGGYVEKTVKAKNLKNVSVTVCSVTAGEIAIVEEMALDYINTYKDDDGEIEGIPNNNAKAYKQMIEVALGVTGINGKELSDKAAYQLGGIKKGIIKYDELVFDGDMEGSKKILEMIKQAVKFRAMIIRRMSAPLIDMITAIKYDFNAKMFDIMNTDDILPKS